MPTTTLDYITAEDGTSDTIDLSQRLNTVTDSIYINDIDIRWRGNETRRENTFTETATNVNTDSSTGEKTTNTITDTDYYWDYEKNYNTDTFTAEEVTETNTETETYYVYDSNTNTDTFTAEEVTETNTETETYYVYDSNTNSDSFTATVEDSETITRKNRVTSISNFSFTTTVPSKPSSDSSVEKIVVRASVDNNADSFQAKIVVDGTTVFTSDVLDDPERAYGFPDTDVTDIASPGDTVELKIDGDAPPEYEIDEYAIEAKATFEKPGEVNTGRAETTYPPVPDGYEFARHEYQSGGFDNNFYRKQVGVSVVSAELANRDGETVSIELTTVGKKEKTRENTTTTTKIKTGRAETTYPPVPDGYEFVRHEYDEPTFDTNFYENLVGTTVASNALADEDGETVSLTLTTVGKKQKTREKTTTTKKVKTGRATATYPPVPDGYQFHRHEYDGTKYEDRYIYDNRVGTTVDSRAFADEDGQTVELQLATVGKKRESRTTTRTVTNFDNPPAETTFPPVPNGYDFVKHEVRGDTNNRYIYNNRVGETVQSNRPQSDGETVTIEAVTYGTRTQTNVSYDQTQYAELTGDITASVTTTLNDNETTSTRNVDTHQSGVTSELEVNYNIGNSEYADYQLTIDWGYPYALPQHGSLALKEDGQWYLVAIADPNSPALKHNHIRLYDDQTGTWGAIDVAPVDAPRTIESYRFYDNQTDQWFAPRYYDTRQA